MPMFRKKPVVIEAFQVPLEGEECSADMRDFLRRSDRDMISEYDGSISIFTLEGTMSATPGDWIIRGTAGEYYPCKPDVFADVYEDAE